MSQLLKKLIESLQCLPGIGPKSAQRMALHLLQHNRSGGLRIAELLAQALEKIGYCQQCQSLSEQTCCALCQNSERDSAKLCVVESPADILAIESTGGYQGLYFVLKGRLSPLDGLGPREIGLEQLGERFKQGVVQEVILATSSTVEGEATAYYIAEMAKQVSITATRIAHGVPLGGELEFVDNNTLMQAMKARVLVSS